MTAKTLDGVRRDFHGGIGRQEFGHGAKLGGILRIALIQQPGRFISKLPSRFRLRDHVSDHELNSLNLCDGLPCSIGSGEIGDDLPQSEVRRLT